LSYQEKGFLQQFRPFQYSSPVVQSTDSRQPCTNPMYTKRCLWSQGISIYPRVYQGVTNHWTTNHWTGLDWNPKICFYTQRYAIKR